MRHNRLLAFTLVLTLLLSGCAADSLSPSQSAVPSVSVSQASRVERSYHDASVPDVIPNRDREIEYTTHSDFLWKVEGGPGTVHLMGTMHVLKPDYALTPEILALLDEADALAVEANILDVNSLTDANQYMFYSDYSSIYNHLSERGNAHLKNMCEEYGVDPTTIEMFHAFTISSSFLAYILLNSDYTLSGVDMKLLVHATQNEIPIRELEDFRTYYAAFQTLDDDTLERMCIMTIAGPKETLEDLDDMYDIFIAGDEEKMLAYLFEDPSMGNNDEEPYIAGDGLPLEFEEKDELYKQYMVDDRNRVMADSIVSYIEGGDNVLAAAGLAHFLGEGSVIDLLEQEGYTVTRVLF